MRTVVFVALLSIGCATAPRAPAPAPRYVAAVPPAVDVEALVPPALANPFPAKGPQFDDVPIDEGRCKGLPSGILVSEATYAESLVTTSERNRLRTEVRVLRDLRGKERAAILDAERAYQARIAELERAAARPPSLWDRVKFVAGFALGAAVTAASAAAAARAVR